MALQPGTRLGGYDILGLIGAGGMGEVYRARDPRLGRDVASKALPADRVADEGRRRFVPTDHQRFAEESARHSWRCGASVIQLVRSRRRIGLRQMQVEAHTRATNVLWLEDFIQAGMNLRPPNSLSLQIFHASARFDHSYCLPDRTFP